MPSAASRSNEGVSLSGWVRDLFVEAPNSMGARARLRRWTMLRESFPRIEEMRVLDLGGTVEAWERSPVRPKTVTVLNVNEPGVPRSDWIKTIAGDACDARNVIEAAGMEATFDIVYSNSLIEHLGGHSRRLEFALQVLELADHHWIQTPYRYFPLEPHWLFPLMQFLPTVLRAQIAAHWPLANTKPRSSSEARDEVLWTDLIGMTDMRHYFPQARLHRERVIGLTKSLIAIA